MRSPWIALCVLIAIAACGDDRSRAARAKFNEGVAKLAEGELDAAEQALLAARDQAGYDDEVRFRAAFDLAAVSIARGEAAASAQPPDAGKAVAAYEQARTWLSDAVRRRPDDAEARANLERVQARILALVDEATKGENGLEKRLDRAIEAERGLRDLTRGLWAQQVVGGDPLAGRDQLEAAATQQRTLAAEVGAIADLAGDEITAIGGKKEEERSDEEKVRLVQLQNLDLYVQDARKAMTDARRNLHELRAQLAHGRIAMALESLKRAREQLLDPIAVLQGVAADELQLGGYLDALAKLQATERGPEGPAIPAWLSAKELGGEQVDLRARLEEVKARLAAALEAPEPAADPNADPQAAAQAEEGKKVRAAIAAAMPAIEDASTAMKRASDVLATDDVAGGNAAVRDALLALARAIEQFLELRRLIDVALAEQRAVVAAITPPVEGAEAPAMSAADRKKLVDDGVAKNRARLARMQAMIADELARAVAEAQAEAQEAAAAAAQAGQAPDPSQPDPAAQAVEQAQALYAQAEQLRGQADAALAELAKVAAGGAGAPALESATLAQDRLVELQKLFFSVIEHLKELIRTQGETRDDTTTAQAEDDTGRAARLPGLIDREAEHAQMAEAIAGALAAQADAAAQAGAQQPPQQQGGPTPQQLGEAASEVRSALGSMQDAGTTLTQARDQAGQASYDITPALDAQKTALEHLENALRLLQPPQQQRDQQDPQQQDQQDQQQQDQQQQDQQSAEQQLRQVREREAQREREKRERERQRGGNDPVDKDW